MGKSEIWPTKTVEVGSLSHGVVGFFYILGGAGCLPSTGSSLSTQMLSPA